MRRSPGSGRQRRWPCVLLSAGLAIFTLAACDRFPRDPERTLDRALERGTLRIGVTDAPPWVIKGGDGEPRGVEAELLRSFAGSLGIDVEWRWGSAATNLQALQHG